MDIISVCCGEPLDLDCLHDEADEQGSTFTEVMRAYQSRGCAALTVYPVCDGTRQSSLRTESASALYDLLGDDIDGAAAMMEDFGF